MLELGPLDLDSDSRSDYDAYLQTYMSQFEPSLEELQAEFQASMEFVEWEFDDFFERLRTSNGNRLDNDVDTTLTEIEEARKRTRGNRLWIITEEGVNTGKRVIEIGEL